ncbi:MAG: acetylglutamate kinase [Acidobacteriaceae bacterium]|nr:acetylglutamate kinase [Acidobacteriaceae bacterium]
MKVLVKLGGTLLDDADSRNSLGRQLAEVSRRYELVAVHGGGKQVTRYLEERGIASRFVGGLRVSDDAVIEAVTKVIAGTVNKQLVSAIVAAGESAVGLSGIDGPLTTAVQLSPELGAVGKPVKTDGRLLNLLVNAGHVPVIACVAGDVAGRIYNVNADQMAVSCALGWGASKLLFLTDVPGVKDSSGSLIARLSPGALRHLISSGVAHGGMQAKLEAAITALQGGVEEITVALGREPGICHRLLAGESLGTRILAEVQ